ncbi:MAG TPA: hypothetical protein VGK99_03095 [Acidobacteriota bacterium]
MKPPLAVLEPGSLQNFQVQGAGGPFTWKVNGIPGGTPLKGVITDSGVFKAPNLVPLPRVVTVTAELNKQIAGGSVDVLERNSIISGLGVVQSVVYLTSLNRLYEAGLSIFGLCRDYQSWSGSMPTSFARPILLRWPI